MTHTHPHTHAPTHTHTLPSCAGRDERAVMGQSESTSATGTNTGCWRLPCGGNAYAEDGIDDASLPSLQSASETESETEYGAGADGETEYEAGADGASLQSVSETGTDDGATDNESDGAMTIGQVLDARISATAHLHPGIFGQTPVVIVGEPPP